MQMSFMTSFFCSRAWKGVEIKTNVKSTFSSLYARIRYVDEQDVALS